MVDWKEIGPVAFLKKSLISGVVSLSFSGESKSQIITKLYAAPVPPADVAELQEECTALRLGWGECSKDKKELERKLAELQSQNNFDATRLRALASKCGVSVPESDEELLSVSWVVLGSIRRVVDQLYSDPQSREEGRQETMTCQCKVTNLDGLCVECGKEVKQ